MSAPIVNRSSPKMIQWFPSFSGGVNTTDAVHAVPDNQLVEGINFTIDEVGSVSKRMGYSRIVASLGVGKIQNLFLFNKGATRTLLAVYNGLLYMYNTADPYTFLETGNWVEVPIRRHAPQGLVGSNATSGAVGANITVSTAYDFQIAAKDAIGVTKASTVTRVTSGTTAYPIILSWDKVLGAINYDIYVNSKLLKANVGDVNAWTWTGAEAPQVGITPPATDTTKLSIIIDSEFITWNDRCYFTSGNGICSYDGMAASLVVPYVPNSAEVTNVGINALRDTTSSMHKCRLLRAYRERLFIGADPDNGRSFYFTDLGMSPAGGGTLWFPGTYAANMSTETGEPITAMVLFRENLVFFSRSSIFTLFGKQPIQTQPDAFEIRPTNTTVGALSQRGVAAVDNALLFVSKLGIYALVNVFASDRDKNVTYVSLDVEKTFYRITRPEQAVATFHNHQYTVCFPADGLVLRFYVNHKAWAMDDKPMASAYMVVDRDLYIGDNADGLVYKASKKRVAGVEVDTFSDDGVAINWDIRTKSYSVNSPINEKKTQQLFVAAKQYPISSTVILTATMDYAVEVFPLNFNESTALGTWELGKKSLGWVDSITKPMRWKQRGHFMYFRFQNNIIDEPITIYGLGTMFKMKKA